MRRINTTSILSALAAAALLFVGCNGTLERPEPTKDDVSTFAAALEDGKSPAEACKELNDVCATTGQGCNAFDYFCGEVYGEACNKLQEVCQLIPEACDLHQQHCDGRDPGVPPHRSECCDLARQCVESRVDPSTDVCIQAAEVCSAEFGFELPDDWKELPTGGDDGRLFDLFKQMCEQPIEPPEPKDRCCDLAGQCVASFEHDTCIKAAEVCRDQFGFEIDPELRQVPEGEDLKRWFDLYEQMCNQPVEPPAPQERCCDVAMACMSQGDDAQCELALKVCGDELGYKLPQELPEGMDWEQLEQLIKQVCEDPGQVPPPEPTFPEECCKMAMSCIQNPAEEYCFDGVRQCGDLLGIPGEQIPWEELEKYIPMIEQVCQQHGF